MFTRRVREHVSGHARSSEAAAAIVMWELGWGIIALRDAKGAFHVYFDCRRWRSRMSLVWRNGEESARCPPACRGTIIRMLPMLDGALLRGIEFVVAYAQRHLKSLRSDGQWHRRVRLVPTANGTTT